MMIEKSLEKFLNEAVKEVSESVIKDITKNATLKIEENLINDFGFKPQVLTVKTLDKETNIKGVTHEMFETALTIVNQDIPLYLSGPAGTGKNVICKQIAEALNLKFYFSNAVTQEYKLTGFIDGMGKYQETQFYKAFTEGGLFFLDEIDASIPEVLVILNAAIANRYFDFPTGKVEAHKDFRVIAAGNTTGTGADLNYTGRYSLDKASLDRFAMIEINYSPAIEQAMAKNDRELIDFVHYFRNAASQSDINCLFTYRSIDRIATLSKIMDDLLQVFEIALLKGLPNDDLTILTNKMVDDWTVKEMSKNKYGKLFIENFYPDNDKKTGYVTVNPDTLTFTCSDSRGKHLF